MKFGRLIPKQRELSGAIGGARMFISRIGIYISIMNWVMLSNLFWLSSSLVRSIFLDSYLLFSVAYVGLVAVMLYIEYVIMLPSEIRFTQHQLAKGNRSPIYREVVETRKMVEKLLAKSEGVRG